MKFGRNLQDNRQPCNFLQVKSLTCKFLQVEHLTCKFLHVNNSPYENCKFLLVSHLFSIRLKHFLNCLLRTHKFVHTLTFSCQESYQDLIKIFHVLPCFLSRCFNNFHFTGLFFLFGSMKYFFVNNRKATNYSFTTIVFLFRLTISKTFVQHVILIKVSHCKIFQSVYKTLSVHFLHRKPTISMTNNKKGFCSFFRSAAKTIKTNVWL